jgi:hypothetical protein
LIRWYAASSTWRAGHGGCSAVAAELRVAALLAAPVRLTQPIDAEKACDVSELRITLDVLTSAERRDLANALLRAAWSAVLEETRILLLDLLLEADDAMPIDAR